jgi:phosphate butyryltransferase
MSYENRTFDELRIGEEAEIERLARAEDFYVFAHASGNHNPMHLAAEDGVKDGDPEAIAPAMWLGSLISAVLGNVLPGPGTLYRSQSLKFRGMAQAGDTVKIGVRVVEKLDNRHVVLETWVRRSDGAVIAEGLAEVLAPAVKVIAEDGHIPGLTVQRHVHFDALLAKARPLPPIPTVVVSPESEDALEGALLGARNTLIEPILVGCESKIRAVAAKLGEDIDRYRLVNVPEHAAAAAEAVTMVRKGEAQALMKGHLHTDTLLGAVVRRDGGLRTGRRLSHIYVMDVPGLDRLLMITDAAINIDPDLAVKADIVQNAIDLCHALGIAEPKVAVLSAVEVVNPHIISSVHAAVLSKMAERGQITGGFVDGPLALDNAVSIEAARTKGLKSPVAGRADVLVAPDLDAANMVGKELTFLAHAEAGGVVMGAQAPVILTSRADDEKARLASCAVAALYARWKAGDPVC